VNKLLASIMILIAPFSYAACPGPVTHLNAGDVACDEGYLFSKAKEQEVRLIKEQLDNLNAEMTIRDQQISIYIKDFQTFKNIQDEQTKEVELYKTAATTATQKYIDEQNGRFTRDVLCFAAGVLTLFLGSLAIKNVR
jgi:hypothetical protein